MTAPQAALVSAPRRSLRGGLLAAGLALAVLTSLSHTTHNVNVASRFATAESLVERHTFRIDDSSFASTKDKVYVGGHFYSEKPPLLSVLAAAAYWPLYHAGLRLRPEARLAPALITFLILGSSFLLCLGCFAGALRRAGLPDARSIFMTAVLGFATLYLAWNTTFSNHGFVASWLFVGLYCWLRSRAEDGKTGWLWACGAALALAVATDYSVLPFPALLAALALLSRSGGLRASAARAAILMVPLFVMAVPTLAFNYAISATWRPLQVQAELFRYPGSWWTGTQEHLSGVSYNTPGVALHQAYLMLIGSDGFLIYNPVLMLALMVLVLTIVRRRRYWQEAAAVLLFSLLFVGYYSVATTNLGGFNYSNRWLAELIPLLWFFAFPLFQRMKLPMLALVAVLAAASASIALVGTINPWQGEKPAFWANVYSLLPGARPE